MFYLNVYLLRNMDLTCGQGVYFWLFVHDFKYRFLHLLIHYRWNGVYKDLWATGTVKNCKGPGNNLLTLKV